MVAQKKDRAVTLRPIGTSSISCAAEGADNLQWVWHVNWLDEPEAKWNPFENYFPGENYCDWVALSAYGPTTPRMEDGTEISHSRCVRHILV